MILIYFRLGFQSNFSRQINVGRRVEAREGEKPTVGLEPTTYALRMRCSTIELRRPGAASEEIIPNKANAGENKKPADFRGFRKAAE